MYQKLGDSGTKMNLTGTLGLNDCNQSHMLAPKGKALKQCDKCHDADSKSFKAVSMAIITPNGHEERYNVNPAVLGSMFSNTAFKPVLCAWRHADKDTGYYRDTDGRRRHVSSDSPHNIKDSDLADKRGQET